MTTEGTASPVSGRSTRGTANRASSPPRPSVPSASGFDRAGVLAARAEGTARTVRMNARSALGMYGTGSRLDQLYRLIEDLAGAVADLAGALAERP